jgi:hypothetical protein
VCLLAVALGVLLCSVSQWFLVLLVAQLSVQLVMHRAAWVHHHWSLLIVVRELLVLCLKIQGLARCLREGFLHQIRVCRVIRSQGMASW